MQCAESQRGSVGACEKTRKSTLSGAIKIFSDDVNHRVSAEVCCLQRDILIERPLKRDYEAIWAGKWTLEYWVSVLFADLSQIVSSFDGTILIGRAQASYCSSHYPQLIVLMTSFSAVCCHWNTSPWNRIVHELDLHNYTWNRNIQIRTRRALKLAEAEWMDYILICPDLCLPFPPQSLQQLIRLFCRIKQYPLWSLIALRNSSCESFSARLESFWEFGYR